MSEEIPGLDALCMRLVKELRKVLPHDIEVGLFLRSPTRFSFSASMNAPTPEGNTQAVRAMLQEWLAKTEGATLQRVSYDDDNDQEDT